MNKENIEFFVEDISFFLINDLLTSEWILQAIHSENNFLNSLNFIFCSDNYLLQINQQYLNHDYYTDIITFNNSDTDLNIEGDIYVSIDRVSENAKQYNISFLDELHRVIIHGVLHLLGYDDNSSLSKQIMTEKENYYLSLLKI